MANPKIVLKFNSAIKGDSVSFLVDGVLRTWTIVASDVSPLGFYEIHAGVGAGVANEFSASFAIEHGSDPYTTNLNGDELTIEADIDSPTYNFGTVIINDAKGSDIELLEQIVTGITLTPTVTDCTGFGVADGEVIIAVTGGSPPFTWLWSDGAITKDRTGLAAGTYTVTGTDDDTNQVSIEVTIDQPDPITIEATVDENDISVTVSGGVAPYTYLWNTGAITKDLSDLDLGTYTLTVTDDNGYTNQVIVTITDFKFYFSQNPVAIELTAVDPGTKPNLSFINKVLVQKAYPGGSYDLVATEEHLSAAGSTVFQIEAYLDAFLHSYVPDPLLNGIVRADGMFAFFSNKSTEKYGEPPAEATSTVASNNAVILGGLSDLEFAADNFDSFLSTQKPFLNWELSGKVMLPNQPDYLYFLVNSFDQTGMRVKVKVYFDDKTNTTITKYTMDTIAKRYEVYCFPVGYSQLDLANVDSEKTVLSWEVWVEDQDDSVVSEVRSYELDSNYYPYQRFLLYLSSLGGMSTIALTGKAEKQVKMDQELIEKYLSYNFNIQDLGTKVTYSKGKPQIRFNSGYITDQEAFERLEDFIHSEEVYLLDVSGSSSRWIPVRCEADKTPIYDEMRQDALNVLSGTVYLPESRRFSPRL